MKQYTIQHLDLSNKSNTENFIKNLHNKFIHHDIFESITPFELKLHYHLDKKSRLFLEGNAEFILEGNSIECVPGTYIEIEENVPHAFIYKGVIPLKVIRFFDKEENWKATFIEE